MINLIFALFWLMLGIAVLIRQLVFDDPTWYLRVGDNQLSWAWLMLFLFAYNVARWWSVRISQRHRDGRPWTPARRRRVTRGTVDRAPSEPPNPEFDFTSEPRSETGPIAGSGATGAAGATAAPNKPISFGYKCAWYAVRTRDTDAVVAALGLVEAAESNWLRGAEGAYADKIFVTPPVGEWTLAVGRRLFYEGNPAESAVVSTLTKLSETFGESQYFATHRVVEAHCWALARSGKLVRGYSYVGDRGEVVWNEGQPTDAEQALGHEVLESGPNESQLMEIAGAWSVNPSELESRFPDATAPGRLGRKA
jgi:hypothetical protein